ncbi:MAG: S1/P1 nuclease [Dysgonamonadaceae bacterium]|jgi:hypothetical protein|nr:S1/P1 nuclease [Dysgonamonadaceae bacterium]
MKHHRFQTVFSLLVFFFLPSAASAWGTLGHRIVGEISENLLDENVRERITAIIGNASIAMISNWGDEVRSDSAYNYTATWHYTNFDSGLTRAAFDTIAVKQTDGQNIYRVAMLTDYLKRAPNDTAMLKMLIHLVGDMHCPLHFGQAADRGGNSIPCTWFGTATNLHSLWDSYLIDSQKLSYTEYAIHLMRVNDIQNSPFDGYLNTILDWAWDNYTNAQIVYASSGEVYKYYEYTYRYKNLWEHSLVKAAEHLASLLNYIYQ